MASTASNLLAGVSGVEPYEIRHFGETLAGVCDFEATKYQKRKALRRGTRAGSIAIWCANEALNDAGLDGLRPWVAQRVGVYVGTTEHGNVETENEIHEVAVRLRPVVLVAPPQPAHGREQPRGRGHAQHGHHGARTTAWAGPARPATWA